MSFVDPHTGAKVHDNDTHRHRFMYITLDTEQEWELVRAKFSALSFLNANGTTVIKYNQVLALLFENAACLPKNNCDVMAVLSVLPTSGSVVRSLLILGQAITAYGNDIVNYGRMAANVAAADLTNNLTTNQREELGFSASDMLPIPAPMGPVGPFGGQQAPMGPGGPAIMMAVHLCITIGAIKSAADSPEQLLRFYFQHAVNIHIIQASEVFNKLAAAATANKSFPVPASPDETATVMIEEFNNYILYDQGWRIIVDNDASRRINLHKESATLSGTIDGNSPILQERTANMCFNRFDVLSLLLLGNDPELPSKHAAVSCLLAVASALQPTNPTELPAATIEPDKLFTFTGLARFDRALRSWSAFLNFPEVREATLNERVMMLTAQIMQQVPGGTAWPWCW